LFNNKEWLSWHIVYCYKQTLIFSNNYHFLIAQLFNIASNWLPINQFIYYIDNNNNNNNVNTSIAPLSSKRIELSGTPSTGDGQTHSPSIRIRWTGNLARISEYEKVSFQMVTERNYAIWWLNLFRGWIPKSRGSNWKNTSSSMWLTMRKPTKTKWTEFSGLGC
jgi:hypothetical protein